LSALLSKRSGDRLTLKELSTLLGYSEKYTSEIFRKYMGLSFSEYLKQLHLAKATKLLNDQSLTIAQIAESVGFSDAFAFSHFFKRAIGCSPSEFRKQQTPEAGLKMNGQARVSGANGRMAGFADPAWPESRDGVGPRG
jgi:AraC-like DNA-binding protein